jgi:hypothetical protein
MALADVEVFSAAYDVDITEPCRVMTRVRGGCDVCGFVAVSGLHCPLICHGTFCGSHCPVCTGAVRVSDAEREAMTANKLGLTTKREKLAPKANQHRLTRAERSRIRCEARVRKQQIFQNKTLRVGAAFTGIGLIGDLIREADGLPIRDLLAVSRNACVSAALLRAMMAKGIAEGVLTVV